MIPSRSFLFCAPASGLPAAGRRIRDLCREHGVAEPVIEVSESWVTTTTFTRPVTEPRDQAGTRLERGRHQAGLPDRQAGAPPQLESGPESRPESGPGSFEQRVLWILRQAPMSRSAISTRLGHKSVSGRLKKAIRLLMDDKLIEYTIPEKPNSRLQKYRLTESGKTRLAEVKDGRS